MVSLLNGFVWMVYARSYILNGVLLLYLFRCYNVLRRFDLNILEAWVTSAQRNSVVVMANTGIGSKPRPAGGRWLPYKQRWWIGEETEKYQRHQFVVPTVFDTYLNLRTFEEDCVSAISMHFLLGPRRGHALMIFMWMTSFHVTGSSPESIVAFIECLCVVRCRVLAS